jgi:hypothetical protein
MVLLVCHGSVCELLQEASVALLDTGYLHASGTATTPGLLEELFVVPMAPVH